MTEESKKPDPQKGASKDDKAGGEIDPGDLIRQIEQLLVSTKDDETFEDERSIEFPLSSALSLLPKQYIKQVESEEAEYETIVVTIDDLFEQLAVGKVEMPVSKLSYFIPLHLIYHAALDDKSIVKLPLQSVVRSVGLLTLKDHTPSVVRFYDIDKLEDPFEESKAKKADVPVIILEDEDEEEGEKQEVAEEKVEEPIQQEPEVAPEKPKEKAEKEVVADKPQEDSKQEKPAEEKQVEPEAEKLVEEKPVESEKVEEKQEEPVKEVEPVKESVPEKSFNYSVDEALTLIPAEYLIESTSSADNKDQVAIHVPDIYNQLGRGRVDITLGILAGFLPPELVTDQARKDSETTVTLSLSSVVSSIGVDTLKKRTPGEFKKYDIDEMADPFKEPDELPKLVRPKKVKKEEPEDTAVPISGQAAVQDIIPSGARVLPYDRREEAESELEYKEFPGNVNINSAEKEELMILDSIDQEMAGRIINYRAEHDGFKSVFDLQEIEGIDDNLFRKLTGMKPGNKRYHRRKRLAGLLNMEPKKVNDLSLITKRFVSKPGFSECIISDRSGLVIAQSGNCENEVGEALSAVAPRMINQIRHNMNIIDAGHVGTVSMSIDGMLYTIAASENVALIAIHEENLISETELSFVRKVSKELAWLLSLRAYVGPTV